MRRTIISTLSNSTLAQRKANVVYLEHWIQVGLMFIICRKWDVGPTLDRCRCQAYTERMILLRNFYVYIIIRQYNYVKHCSLFSNLFIENTGLSIISTMSNVTLAQRRANVVYLQHWINIDDTHDKCT